MSFDYELDLTSVGPPIAWLSVRIREVRLRRKQRSSAGGHKLRPRAINAHHCLLQPPGTSHEERHTSSLLSTTTHQPRLRRKRARYISPKKGEVRASARRYHLAPVTAVSRNCNYNQNGL